MDPASTVLLVLLSRAERQLLLGPRLCFDKAGTTSPNPWCPSDMQRPERAEQTASLLPAGQLIPQHTLALVNTVVGISK